MIGEKDYFQEYRLLQDRPSRLLLSVLFIGLILFPLISRGDSHNYYVFVANLLFINIITAVGYNIVVGNTGLISLGHSGFLAIGAYASIILMTKIGAPFPIAILSAGIITAVLGFIVGLPALKLEGPYLAIATLGFGIAVEQVLGLSKSLTGGMDGIDTPPYSMFGHVMNTDVSLGPIVLSSEKQIYYVILFVTVVLTFAAARMMKSRVGRGFTAVRDSAVAARSLGVNVTYFKSLAFAVSAFYMGVAGSLNAHMVNHINPSQYGLMLSITMVAMIVVGGLGSITGSILGAVLFTLLHQILAAQDHLNAIITGLVMVLIIIFEPRGLSGVWRTMRGFFKRKQVVRGD
ncbi:MAG: branched-chain amino acid ABC transporter permease [Deltaproteobacteria bacterium]|nr:branched-chain amino acid ABC transporter permease [Candidatus Zymogenaceae bacterium]